MNETIEKILAGIDKGTYFDSHFVIDTVIPDFHFSFGSANHRVASDAFIYTDWKALKALRRSTPHG